MQSHKKHRKRKVKILKIPGMINHESEKFTNESEFNNVLPPDVKCFNMKITEEQNRRNRVCKVHRKFVKFIEFVKFIMFLKFIKFVKFIKFLKFIKFVKFIKFIKFINSPTPRTL